MKHYESRNFRNAGVLKIAMCLAMAGGAGIPAAYAAMPPAGQNQQSQLTGTVYDQNGEPVIGASVMVKGTSLGTATDLDGKFVLNAPKKGSTITISYIGYKPVEIVYSGQASLEVNLQEDTAALDEVIVVGYGTQKKATLTGSVSQVGGEDLKKMSAANLSNTLSGKTAGVIGMTLSGEPGEDGSTLLIRGKGTLGNTSPLIVVDGIADRSFSRIDPNDIESISVLKDASAAIYGARAANGVILVTTKRGKSGKVNISYNGSYTWSQPTRIPKMLNAFEYGTYVNEYDADPRHGQSGITYSEEALNHYKNHDDPLNFPDTDWWDAVAKDWTGRTSHSVNISGGTEKVSFYSSLQYQWQDAMYKKSAQDYRQFQFTSNVDVHASDWWNFSFDIRGRREERNRGIYETNYLFTYFLTTFPGSAPYFPDGRYRAGYDGVTRNAAVMVTDEPGYNRYRYNILNLKPRFRVNLDMLTKGLYVEGYAAIDMNFNNGKQFNQPYDLYEYDKGTQQYKNVRDQTGQVSVNSWSNWSSTVTLNARLAYDREFNELHKVNAFVAYEQSKYNYSTVSAYRTNFMSPLLPEIDFGSNVPEDLDNSGYSDVTTRRNVFGRINYAYDSKYLAEFTMRYDGSMNFAKGHRWGLFPAVSLGYVMSEESYWAPVMPVVNFFKLKASWGKMGNDNISAYQFMEQYLFNDKSPYFGEVGKGHITQGIYLNRVANPLVTWESATTWNLGFSSYFLNSKFMLDFDWFLSKRKDILCYRNASIPYYAGMSLPVENLGRVKNTGVELVATYQDRVGDFNWSVTGTFTYANNTVEYMDEAKSVPAWQKTEGHPIDGIVAYKAIGIYQTQEEIDNSPHIAGAAPGDLIYQDMNGDEVITWDDAIRLDESATPKIIYGITLNGGWKGIDFNCFFQGQGKSKKLVQPGMNMVHDFYEGRWRAENTPEQNAAARWPKAFIKQTYGDNWNGTASTWWLRNADFLRLKSIELGYTFPDAWMSKAGIEKLRVYINGSNLFTIDKFKVADPEIDGYITSYPLSRSITVGAGITF